MSSPSKQTQVLNPIFEILDSLHIGQKQHETDLTTFEALKNAIQHPKTARECGGEADLVAPKNAPFLAALNSDQENVLNDILNTLKSLQMGQRQLHIGFSTLSTLVSRLPTENVAKANEMPSNEFTPKLSLDDTEAAVQGELANPPLIPEAIPETVSPADSQSLANSSEGPVPVSRIILTTYPGRSGTDPLAMNWGHKEAIHRGPVVVSRRHGTLKRRNAIGAHGGSYSIYYALGVAIGEIKADHMPDFTNTEPVVKLGPFPRWADPKKIVSLDPFGHLAPSLFKDLIKGGVDIRPTIAITKAHMKLPELEQSVKLGRLVPDGKICINETGEIAVTKFAVDPVWYLPGVAERFGIDEGILRRSLFEYTGGSYPELITRGDIKLFLPPIGGLTVYCFGDPSKMSDPNVRLALRVHDECNGSDVFSSDICTCRPYLTFGIEEAVKEAQKGGSGVVIYFRKEGRALGEVTKYLVYNARKHGTDKASEYFLRTENIAGVKVGKASIAIGIIQITYMSKL
ncbi:MAG: Uracil-regulated protein 1 [Trizodia sp. TS-e1964]|nr:MAG: Uracil-regulated protein 1 [Trizodia sp. TS-e1964]